MGLWSSSFRDVRRWIPKRKTYQESIRLTSLPKPEALGLKEEDPGGTNARPVFYGFLLPFPCLLIATLKVQDIRGEWLQKTREKTIKDPGTDS